MRKRRLLRWSLILIIFAAFAVWLEPTRVAWGWLHGEAFYQGRPTSYWAAEIGCWQKSLIVISFNERHEACEDGWMLRYNANPIVEWLDRNWRPIKRNLPALLTADPDPDARNVLQALANCSDPRVCEIARERLLGRTMGVTNWKPRQRTR